MTRKDYEMIAKIMKDTYYINDDARLTLSKDFADALSLDNPRFDRLRFLVACGVVEAPMKTVSKVLEREAI